ncbi:MAG TPA: Na/Pi cotransporter family protein [Clostridia bacterium]|nr:Na/Pi cotransporter family protein [Clostridia bacterium]
MNSAVIKIIFEVFGGLGLFLYGMKVMSDGLEQSAGNKMESIIEALTKNRFLAVIVGAVVTVLVQSSSATTVMVVGFVNAGIMTLTQSIGIIMGANIGTTFTAQLVSLDITAVAPLAIGTGVMIKLFVKDEKISQYSDVLIGFGILFFGMDVMKGAMKPLRTYQGFIDLLASFGRGGFFNIILAVFTGFAITTVLQSSSASTGILVALASQGILPIEAAFPIVLGTNIGTCVTAMISSIGASKNAKRAALIHLIFNITGALVFLIFFRSLTVNFVKTFSFTAERQLANAHTLFNIANTVMLLPFAGLIIRMVKRIIPEDEEELSKYHELKYVDDRLLETPSIAIVQVMKEVLHIGNMVDYSFNNSKDSVIKHDKKLAKEVFKKEREINKTSHAIVKYMFEFTTKDISPEQRKIVEGLFGTVSDLERIGDHCDNIAEISVYKIDNNISFSGSAIEEITYMYERVGKSYLQALKSIKTGDVDLARSIIEREGEIDELEKQLRKKHIERLNEGKCGPSAGIVFLDIISNLERIADHASNIAFTVIDKVE